MRTFAAKQNVISNEKGFSLVELMVVVAIIGILSSIAIPSLQRYMAKARQTEAKTNLASLYTAEKSFFAEYNTYWVGFNDIGFAPEGNLRYNVGFNGSSSGITLTSYGFPNAGNAAMHSAQAYCAAATSCKMMAEAQAIPGTAAGQTTPTTDANQIYFTAAAASKIYKNNQDVWSINDTKNLMNSVDGVTGY